MFLALSGPSAGWQAVLWIVALVAFFSVVVYAMTRKPRPAWEWFFLGAGLTAVAVLYAWAALAAA